MIKITKKEFKEMYRNQDLALLVGLTTLTKDKIMQKIEAIDNIEPYKKLTSNYTIDGSNISIYKDGKIIFVEEQVNSERVYNTVYIIN